MDVKVYDEKVRDLQSHLPFLETFIKQMEAKPIVTGPLQKFRQLYKLVESTRRQRYNQVQGCVEFLLTKQKTFSRHPISVIDRVENTIREIKTRCETKVLFEDFLARIRSLKIYLNFVIG